MRIFQPALDRLTKADLTGQQIATIVESLLAAVNQHNLPGGTLNLHYVQEGEQPGPDELVPVVAISLAPVVAVSTGDITGEQAEAPP